MTREEAQTKRYIIESTEYNVPTIREHIDQIYDDFESREKELLTEIDRIKKFNSGDELPSQKLLHEMFNYIDGELVWKIKKSGSRGIGSIAGSVYKDGYKNIMLNGKRYGVHRLVWIYHNGDIENGLEIDHIDGNRSNNNIYNLRNVSRQENCFNNTSSKGYCFDNSVNKWKAYIVINGFGKHLGHFDNEIDAEEAYILAKKKYHKFERKDT